MSVAPYLRATLLGGGVFSLALALVAGVVGWFVSGAGGLASGLLGAALAAVFFGLTAGSILLAARVSRDDPAGPLFFAIILGVWLFKLIAFFIIMLALRGQDWVDPWVFPFTMIAAVLGSLLIDSIAFVRTRVPYVSDVELPGEGSEPRR